jgi:hypothetical protein
LDQPLLIFIDKGEVKIWGLNFEGGEEERYGGKKMMLAAISDLFVACFGEQ